MQLLSNNSSLNLTAAGNLSFSLNKDHCWTGDGPFLILHYYDRQHPRAQTVSAPSGDGHAFGTAGTTSLSAKGNIEVRQISEAEALVIANFPNIHIRIAVRVIAGESGFCVRIEEDGTSEGMSGLYRILGVEILPEFGAARTGETGHLTLPNWSGCQTFFDKSYPREVRQTIYSSNDQWEHVCNMPVFGITREQGTLCGLVAAGDYDAQLVCRVHWEKGHSNSVHPHLVYRWQQQDDPISGPREVRYAFAPADYPGGEGYVFCGKTYREFLRAERGLLTWEEKARTRPVVLDYRDRFFLKIFMAYKDPQADGRGQYHATCTFAGVREILEQCLERGMTKLAVMLVGWGQDGHDGMPPTRFPVDERLGGEEAFRELIAWSRDHGILLGVHDSYGESYRCSPEFDPDDLICHRTGERWQGVIWGGGQVHKTCPSVYVDKHVRRDVAAVRALGIYGHHHLDAVGSFMPCFSKNHPLERRQDFARQVTKMFDCVLEHLGSVSTEMPFGPYFPVVDGFFHSYTDPSPWHRASPVGRFFLDRTVPLLQIALHGSVNCCESVGHFGKNPLHWLDLGLCPAWEVCQTPSVSFGIPAFADVADKMAEIYALYFGKDGLIASLNGLTIKARQELGDGATRTTYSDGSTVCIPPHGAGQVDFRIEKP